MAWQYSDEWQGGNIPFMQNNAKEFYYNLLQDFTLNAICGMLGNIQTESAINPHSKELPVSEWTVDKGYGLVGWTPATKLIEWCEGRGLDYTNGDSQTLMISESNTYWGNSGDPHAPSVTPPITWNDFKNSILPADTLALYFMYYWEKPAYSATEQTKEARMSQALTWYDYLGGVVPPPTPSTRKSMPLYMMTRRIF